MPNQQAGNAKQQQGQGREHPVPNNDGTDVYSSVNLRVFSGQIDESVEKFVRHFNRATKANRWSEATKLHQLLRYLSGSVLDYFETIEEDVASYDKALDCLKG